MSINTLVYIKTFHYIYYVIMREMTRREFIKKMIEISVKAMLENNKSKLNINLTNKVWKLQKDFVH